MFCDVVCGGQVQRQRGGQPPLRIPITKASQTIKLAATLGGLDMEPYGVSASIAATMDKAVKVRCTHILYYPLLYHTIP